MKKLIFRVELKDPFGNVKMFKTFINQDTGMLSHYLVGKSGINFSVSNMQCEGWLPDHLDDARDDRGELQIVKTLVQYIDSGLYDRVPGTMKGFAYETVEG